MDIRTGKTYKTREEALAAGVPESDLVFYGLDADGELRVEAMKKLQFSKGSFKSVEDVELKPR